MSYTTGHALFFDPLIVLVVYGQICIFGAYWSAPNMVKWGVTEKHWRVSFKLNYFYQASESPGGLLADHYE